MNPPLEFQILFYCLTLVLIVLTGYQIREWRLEVK